MATYDLLPVYKTTYDFLLQIFQFSKTFTREYKYTIWQELKNETIRLILAIYRANGSQAKRYELLDDARTTLETIRLLLRLTKDLKQILLCATPSSVRYLPVISATVSSIILSQADLNRTLKNFLYTMCIVPEKENERTMVSNE